MIINVIRLFTSATKHSIMDFNALQRTKVERVEETFRVLKTSRFARVYLCALLLLIHQLFIIHLAHSFTCKHDKKTFR